MAERRDVKVATIQYFEVRCTLCEYQSLVYDRMGEAMQDADQHWRTVHYSDGGQADD